MLRIVCCVCVVVLIVSCNKNYRRLHIEKRVYRDGYYVHVPWERRTPVNEYPKPQPYPVDHSRTAKTDTTRKYAGGATSDSTATTVVGNSVGGQPAGGGNGTPLPKSNCVYGYPSGSANGQQPANGTSTGSQQPSRPVASYQPAPPLQYQPDYGSPPLQRPQTVPPATQPNTVPPPDSSVAVNDSVSPSDEPKKDRSIDFPEGEFSLIAELGFCNPVYTEGIEIKPLSYNAGIAARYTIHPWPRHKLSLEAGAFVAHHFIAQDHHKFKPMFVERYDHERVMQFKTRFMLMDHIYVLRNPDAKFDAVELGVFSDVGFFSTHVAVNNTANIEGAAFERNKSRLFGLHYLRHAQFGMTARIASGMWSVFTNYRFSNVVKASPDGGDLPRLVVGATFILTH